MEKIERTDEQLCYNLYLLYVKLFCISDAHMIFSFLPSSPKEASVEVFSLRAAANENPATVVRAEVGLCGTRLCLLLSQVRCCICLKRESILMRLLLSLEQRFLVRIIVLQFSAYFEYSKSFSDS